MLSLCALAILACPQDLFDLNAPVQGTVRDEAGQPIARAKVQITVNQNARGYTIALSSALWSQPLLPTFSARDGSWVMPLTDLHRSLYGGGPGSFGLEVTAPGYQPWRERLVAGLGGFLGSDVVLHKPGKSETLNAELGEHRSGATILVLRKLGTSDVDATEFRTDKDGKVSMAVPRFPTPLITSTATPFSEFEHSAQVLLPGRSSTPAPILTGPKGPIWEPGPPLTETHRLTVSHKAKEVIAGLRGLYRCPDNKLRWFDAVGMDLPSDSALQLLLVTADGMVSSEAEGLGELELLPAPDLTRDHQISVVDAEGQELADVHGYLWPLTEFDALQNRKAHRVHPRRPLARIKAANGKLVLPERYLGRPTILEIRAPGWISTTVLEPRTRTVPVALVRGVTGNLVVTVVDSQGTSIDDVLVFLDDRSLLTMPRPRRVMRTQEGGVLQISDVAVGHHHLRLVRKGFASSVEKFEIEDGATENIEFVIEPIVPIRVMTQDDDGKPVPFVALKLKSKTPTRSERQHLWTDSRGYLLLADTSVESASIAQQQVGGRGTIYELDDTQATTLVVDSSTRVFLKTPLGRPMRRYVIKHANGGSTSSGNSKASILTLGYLINWPDTAQFDLRLGFGSGVPARVTHNSLSDAKRIGPRLVELDRSQIVRRQPLLINGPSQESLKDLRIEPRNPHLGGAMIISTKIGSLVAIDTSGLAYFVASDRSAWNCRIMHPEFQIHDIAIPAAKDDDTPIEIKLEKGTALSFKLRLTKTLAKGFDYTLTIRHKKNGRYVIYAQDHFDVQDPQSSTITIRSPVAMQPGPYTYDLRITRGISSRKTITLDVGVPRVIDLTELEK